MSAEGTPAAGDPLAVDAERMREMAAAVIDLLVELIADPRGRPTVTTADATELKARLDRPAPEAGRPFEEALAELARDVLPFTSRTAHPGYFAFIPGSGTFVGALGDLLASALNIENSNWLDASGPSQLELVVLDWFKGWIGYPPEAAGVLVSGGSAANLNGLACAREAADRPFSDNLVIYASDQSHSSIARAARTLGFTPEQLRVLPVDDEFRMRPDAVAGAIAADRAAGRVPLAVCAAAGSTNTGAIDPLPELAEICRRDGIWLHVDAAYGGFAALTERGRRWLAGIELADSVTLDPHKWLYQPFECGCSLVRRGELLEDAFRIAPDYLMEARSGVVNFADRNLQLSRTSRVLKVWLSINTFGLAAFREAIDRSLDLARLAEELIAASPELELIRPARLGIVCLRRRFGAELSEIEIEALNRRLVAALERGGEALVSSTRLRGSYVIRLCVLNHTTEERDIRALVAALESTDVDVVADAETAARGGRDQPASDPHQPLVGGGGRDAGPAVEELHSLPLFEGFDDGRMALLAGAGQIIEVDAGQRLTERWGGGRDFYVLLDGAVRVELDGVLIRELGRGDFFGELAALDWGAGYGYTRLATVIAIERSRLLVVPPDVFNRLTSEVASFGERINAAVRERLPRS